MASTFISSRYVSRNAATAHNEWVAEQEAMAAAEAAEDSEYYYYEEGTMEDGEVEYEECLVCEEGEYDEEYEDPAPRFFFNQISQIFDTTRNLPCCKESDIRQTTTEPTGPR